MTYKKIILFIKICFYSLLLIFIVSCGSSEEITVKKETPEIKDEIYIPDLKLNINKVYCWVNLMPGGPNRFHITGDLEIPDSYKYDLKYLKLNSVKIYQNEKNVFSIIPAVQQNEEKSTSELKNIIFSTLQGLKINSNYNIDGPVDIDFIFEEKGETFSYLIRNQKVEKVY